MQVNCMVHGLHVCIYSHCEHKQLSMATPNHHVSSTEIILIMGHTSISLSLAQYTLACYH